MDLVKNAAYICAAGCSGCKVKVPESSLPALDIQFQLPARKGHFLCSGFRIIKRSLASTLSKQCSGDLTFRVHSKG